METKKKKDTNEIIFKMVTDSQEKELMVPGWVEEG